MSAYREAEWVARRGPVDDRSGDARDDWERDRSRVVHSAAFRRLQGKTQVLGIGEGDFHRTRLTHSMEVAQLGRGIVLHLSQLLKSQPEHRVILPSLSLIEVAGFAHDLGHPPYGHGGEVALNYLMSGRGGFESNAQSLRLLARLQSHTQGHGLNLTRRALLGILKYPVRHSRLAKGAPVRVESSTLFPPVTAKPFKCYYDSEQEIVDWILKPLGETDRVRFGEIDDSSGVPCSRYRGLDCQIMELADDISYGVHDFEDAIVLGLLSAEPWAPAARGLLIEAGACAVADVDEFLTDLFGARRGTRSGRRRRAVGALIHTLVTGVEFAEDPGFDHPLLRWGVRLRPGPQRLLDSLQELIVEQVINHPNVQTLELRGRHMVVRLFEALSSDPERLLPPSFRHQGVASSDWPRAICDCIAGMTDGYAARMYERLFIPRHGSIFEKL